VVRATEHWMLVMGTIVIIIVLGFRGGVLGSLLRWTEKDRADDP
jgi:ABC-type branched-subunit amino acid transport system permease subunit